jgi:hypothetical protein
MGEDKIQLGELLNRVIEDGNSEYTIPDEDTVYDRLDEAKSREDLNLSTIFDIGQRIQYLQTEILLSSDTMQESVISTEIYDGMSSDVGDVLESMVEIEILVANINAPKSVVEQIGRRRERLMEKYDHLDENLSNPVAQSLMTVTNDWVSSIDDTLDNKKSIVINNNSHLDIEKVLDSPSSFFGPEVWKWLDKEPENDIQESCRAIAYGLPTASVMLSLRAVEHCLRNWYEYDTGREIKKRNWGEVVGELEDVYDDAADRPPVLSNLDYLKDKRNAVSHPDKIPTEKEAERMLFRIEGTISEIHGQISE